MKLKEDFMTQQLDDTQFLIPMGAESFKGVVRSNKTAAFIIDCLAEETTEDKIVDALCGRFAGAERETVKTDVAEVLDTLRSINALDE